MIKGALAPFLFTNNIPLLAVRACRKRRCYVKLGIRFF